jgi:hypothetical protein
MKDKELKVEEVKAPHTLGGTSYILSCVYFVYTCVYSQVHTIPFEKTKQFFFCSFRSSASAT